MSTTTAPSAEFRSLTISANNGTAEMSQEDGRYRFVYVVTVQSDGTNQHRSFKFHDSIANYDAGRRGLGPDDLLWAFYCFVSDAEAGASTFAEFCEEFGYDIDSRTAEISHKACKRAARKFADLWLARVEPSDVLEELSEMGIG